MAIFFHGAKRHISENESYFKSSVEEGVVGADLHAEILGGLMAAPGGDRIRVSPSISAIFMAAASSTRRRRAIGHG